MNYDKSLDYLQIETHNFCNATCSFCPLQSQKRKKGAMTEELFKKIIDDASTSPHNPDKVYLLMNGEPFLDNRMPGFIKYVNMKLPVSTVYIYTNGHLMTRGIVDELFDLDCCCCINISINCLTDTERMQVMGIPLKPTLINLGYLVGRIKEDYFRTGEQKINFSMSAVPYCKEHEETGWKKRFGYLATLFQTTAHMFPFSNWAGKLFVTKCDDSPCMRVFNQLYVLWDGKVVLCCLDSEAEVVLGDLNDSTIREVLESEEFEAIRKAHRERKRCELKLCGKCTKV